MVAPGQEVTSCSRLEMSSRPTSKDFWKLLRSKTRAFVSINDHEYYITHTDGYWRVQDCEALNDKGHFTDCSELVNTVCEVVELPWICGKSLHDSFSGATVYEAVAA